MKIYEPIFGKFFIENTKVGTYKVYYELSCVKIDSYKSMRNGDEVSLSDEDYNKYVRLLSTHSSLSGAVLRIAHENIFFSDEVKVISLLEVTTQLSKYVLICSDKLS